MPNQVTKRSIFSRDLIFCGDDRATAELFRKVGGVLLCQVASWRLHPRYCTRILPLRNHLIPALITALLTSSMHCVDTTLSIVARMFLKHRPCDDSKFEPLGSQKSNLNTMMLGRAGQLTAFSFRICNCYVSTVCGLTSVNVCENCNAAS